MNMKNRFQNLFEIAKDMLTIILTLIFCVGLIGVILFKDYSDHQARGEDYIEAKKECPEIKNYLKIYYFNLNIGELSKVKSDCIEMKRITDREREIKKTYAF